MNCPPISIKKVSKNTKRIVAISKQQDEGTSWTSWTSCEGLPPPNRGETRPGWHRLKVPLGRRKSSIGMNKKSSFDFGMS